MYIMVCCIECRESLFKTFLNNFSQNQLVFTSKSQLFFKSISPFTGHPKSFSFLKPVVSILQELFFNHGETGSGRPWQTKG